MQHNLDDARQKVITFNTKRFKHALAGTTDEFQLVTQVLPLLLQINSPYLPAYTPNAPSGVANFKLSVYQKHFLTQTIKELTDSEEKLLINQQLDTKDYSIDGVYVMGSVGSITQTVFSDLDVWVCYKDTLQEEAVALLKQKCEAIEKWAKSFNVELNLYLLDQNHFIHRSHEKLTKNELDQENSRSAQFKLLLDEFYRSALRLAGKPLLWLHIWTEKEEDYAQKVSALVKSGELDLNEWVDFGGLATVPADEYFGASLWHLFKGIDSPFKSVIKILLVEAYSAEYPYTYLLSRKFKYNLLTTPANEFFFDTYLAMLERVTYYLKQTGDDFRLDIMRRCFYIKVIMGSDKEDVDSGYNWRLRKLHQIALNWGWSEKFIQHLEQHHNWKIREVKNMHDILVSVMMQSYRHLLQFGRRYKIESSIVPEDISILTRKLYIAFESLPGKVTLLNPQLAQDIGEPYLTFVEVTQDRGVSPGWYLLNHAPKLESLSAKRYVEYNPHLNKLVAWAYFNGLLTARTKLAIFSSNVSLKTLNQFIVDLRHAIPVSALPPTNEELHHPCEIRNLAVVINLTNDPTKNLEVGNNRLQRRNDLFSFGVEQKSLVGSIDLTYRNLWNEIRTLHFSGEHAILDALKVLSNKIYRGAAPPRSVQVLCYSQRFRNSIRDFVSVLVHKSINIQVGTILRKNQIKMLRVAGKTWNMFFEERGINLQEVTDKENKDHINEQAYLKAIQQGKAASYVKLPAEITRYASEGFLQFFFESNRQDDSYNVYILDEHNHVEVYLNCEGAIEDKVVEIIKIYTTNQSNMNDCDYKFVAGDFNFPQFYQLVNLDDTSYKVIPF